MTYLNVLDIDKYFFFKRFTYWKGRVKMKEEEERERYIQFLTPQSPAAARLSQTKAGYQLIHMGFRNPSLWAIICCFQLH